MIKEWLALTIFRKPRQSFPSQINSQTDCSQLRQMHQDTPEINTNSSNLIAHQAYQCSVTKAIVWQSWVYVVVPVILKHQGKGLHQQLV